MTQQTTPAADISASERLVGALAETWRAIQARHPEVPEVAIVVASGTTGRRKTTKAGHFASRRWVSHPPGDATTPADSPAQTGERRLHELLIGGESLVLGPTVVLGTLLHEAAHALAEARGITDTSREGRYHNERFRQIAQELGLQVAEDGHRGWSATTVPAATAEAYAPQVTTLTSAITIYRVPDTPPVTSGMPSPTTGRMLAAVCACIPPRRIRIARTTFEAGDITCEVCRSPFVLTG